MTNDAGWTRDAVKAERDRTKAARKADKKARAAARWQAVKSWSIQVWDFWTSHMLLACAAACVIGGYAWEWRNTGRGWEKLYPNMGAIVYVGAAAAVLMFFVAFRRTFEEFRAKREILAVVWLFATAAMAAVCLWGVWSAVVANSLTEQRRAVESRKTYNQLVLDRDTLKETVELQGPDWWKAAIDKDERTLNALIQTAKGTYDMADLTEGSGCPAPPKKFVMERLCAQANGGIDPFDGQVLVGKRLEIEQSRNGLKKATDQARQLADLEVKVATYPKIVGDEQLEAMKTFATDDMSAEKLLGIMYAVVSALLLLPFGLCADWVLERLEKLREERKATAAQPAPAKGKA